MPVIHPVPKEQADPELHPIYDKLTHVFGHMPNIFGVMAQRPGVLKNFLATYGEVMDRGQLETRYKELAYLKTSQVNGCQY